MGRKHNCHLEAEEKKHIIEEMKGLLALLSKTSTGKNLKTRTPENVPLCLTKRLPRFLKNYDIIPLITSNPVLEIRPTATPSVFRRERDSPDVAYIMIEPEGNPFRTEWDEMRNVRREICTKHNLRYGAHIHQGANLTKSTLDGQAVVPYVDRLEAIGKFPPPPPSPTKFMDNCPKCGKTKMPPSKNKVGEIQKEQADKVICMCGQPPPEYRNQIAFPINDKIVQKMGAKTCSRCKRQIVSPAEMLANWPNIRLEAICLCEALEFFFRKSGFVPKEKDFKTNVTKVPARKSSKIYEPRNIKEICYCKPSKGQNVQYLCSCKLPDDCLKSYN